MILNKIYTSNMVFPAGKTITVCGTGEGSAEITFNGVTKAVSSEGGSWKVQFPSMGYGGPYELTFTYDGKKTVLDNIYIGEVFLMAGQSNMHFRLKGSSTPKEEWKSNKMLRLFNVDRMEEGDYFTSKDGWVECEAETAGEWSAIAYYVGQQISAKSNIAVGVIVCAQGASVIETWVPAGTFESRGIIVPHDKKFLDHFHEIFGRWNGDGVLYNFSLSQVIPYPLSAVVWYQGESDFSMEEAVVYKDELKALIEVWRKDFNDSELPFVVVQIADFEGRVGDIWSTIQKAQYEIQLEVANVASVKSADVCETDDIHPKTKDKLAFRICDALYKLLNI